ncbi:hypothetical protein MHW47_31365 [Streptomyces sp. OfavH-34-F]|uniref:hypothetical protein n=1 Tax=Streptomyces sp. OfavH-34-F TaxID=2917760 RepID=UPI001EF349F8|nr:hypothetical protein [Streptomyces sp. OfavH-34-F]MCG7528926.1 hypothetical protein [Streptomyces sp. OfavH-34-F]
MAYVPQDLLDRVAALEREVRTLRGRAQMRPALNEILGGDVRTGEGGRLICEAPGGNRVFMTGQTPEGDWAVGLGRSTDGTVALTVGDEYNGSGAGQMIRTWSRSGEVIMMDDAHCDWMLGRPWLPFPLYPTAIQGYEGGTAWGYAWVGRGPAQNAVLVLRFSTISSTGGEVRVSYVRGSKTRVLGTWTIPGGSTWVDRTIVQPLDEAARGEEVSIQIEHRNSASGGAIETRVFACYTRNTFDAGEVPTAPPAAVTTEAAADTTPTNREA